MYRVLLVDDEPIILFGLEAMLPWEEYNCTVIGTARNGHQALAFMEQQRPNIVICDITMPVFSGLQLLEQASERYPEIVFIMLTNHNDFNMARDSMRHRAVDYLLKIDLDEAKLGTALERAVHEHDKRRRLAKGELPQPLAPSPSDLILSYANTLLTGKNEAVSRALEGLKAQRADQQCAMCELVFDLSQIPNIKEFSRAETQQLLDFNHKLVEELAQKVFFNNGYVLTPHPSGHLLFFLWNLEDGKIFPRFQTKLTDALGAVSLVRVSLLVTEIMSGEEMSEFRMQLVSLRNEYVYAPRPLLHYTRSMMRANYVEAARRYVDNHVLERLTVQEVAQVIGITPNYLSSLFTRHLKQNFIDYVNQTKVRHACVLLKNQKHMVNEVSQMLGYENAYYFSKVFKKYMNMTPSEYRRRMNQ